MTIPLVSVVIPTYNRSWGLKRAVAGVLAQTFSDFELIIVDDASPDDTPEVVRSFADPRVQYFRQPQNVGVARNWGTGVEIARGEFVSLLMDDDRYEPSFLARRVAALQENPAASLAFSGWRAFDESGRPTRELTPRYPEGLLTGHDLLASALARDCFVGATLYRTAHLRAVWPAAEDAGIVVDYAANVLLATRPGASAVLLSGSDFIMAEHPGQVSQNRTEEAYIATMRTYDQLLIEPLPRWGRSLIRSEASAWLVVGGRAAAARGERSLAVRRLIRAARLRPLSRGPWSQLVRAVTGL